MPSSLGNAMLALLGADQAAGLDWRTMRDELQARYGSAAAAARAAGIPRRTWRYWTERERAGKTPRPKAGTVDALRGALFTARAPADRSVVLETRDRADDRPRTITAAAMKLRDGTMERVARAYAATGDADAAARVFLAGIGTPFYARYLAPRPDEYPAAPAGGDHGDEPGDDDDQGDDDEGEEYPDDEYDDARWEGFITDPDSSTFSGGTVAGVG